MFTWSKISERERGSHGDESYYAWRKKVPVSAAFLARILALRRILTQISFLTEVVTHFQLLFVTFIEYGQHVNKHNIL